MNVEVVKSKLYSLVKKYIDASVIGYSTDHWNIISIHSEGSIHEYVLMEFDPEDGRLWISKPYIVTLRNMFPVSDEVLKDILKEWFENRLDYTVFSVVYYEYEGED